MPTRNFVSTSILLSLSISFLLTHSSGVAGNIITWSSPSYGDVFGPGEIILGNWTSSSGEMTSPTLRLCLADDRSRSSSDDCGPHISPTIQRFAGSYMTLLGIPKLSIEDIFYLQVKDNLGNTGKSPVFALATRAGSGVTNVGSAPFLQPVSNPSSSSDSQPGHASLGPEDDSGVQTDRSGPDDEPIATPAGSLSPAEPTTKSAGVNPLTRGPVASHPESSASPPERSPAIAATSLSSTFAYNPQTSSSASTTHFKSILVFPTTSAQPHLSSSSSPSSSTLLSPCPMITRVPSSASKSPGKKAAVIAPLAVVALLLILAAVFFFRCHRKLLLDKHQDMENDPTYHHESIPGSCRESLPIRTSMPLPNPYTPKHSEFLMSNSFRPKSRISLSTIRTAVPSVWDRRHQWVITNRTPTPSPVTSVKEESLP